MAVDRVDVRLRHLVDVAWGLIGMWMSSLTRQQREALLGLAHNVVVSDGLLDPNEEGMLDEFKRLLAIGWPLQNQVV